MIMDNLIKSLCSVVYCGHLILWFGTREYSDHPTKKCDKMLIIIFCTPRAEYSESDTSSSNCEDVNCRVFYTGDVNCILPCSHDSLCTADFKRWPYDKQTCTLQLGSWFSRTDEVRSFALYVGSL